MRAQPADPGVTGRTLRTLHVVFKTHLDIGFTALASEVTSRYFEEYIPQAIALAHDLRTAGGGDRFVWTTGSWLIYEYLEQASPFESARLEAAIRAGDIVWHGLPFTTHSELVDPSLFEFGLSLSQELDRRFGKQTIAAKMTDVPGHTRGIVPLLAQAGIRFLHIGVNPACRAPAVPPVFVWQDPRGAELVVMYQEGTYGDLMMVPGLDEAILFAHTDDNLGPPSTDQVVATFEQTRRRFPETEIVASTMDRFAQAVLQSTAQLPRVSDEIGDTWIHGIGSDPGKVAQYRELCRLRRRWLASGAVAASDPRLVRFSRSLLPIPEHSWGLDEKVFLADYSHYAAQEFQAARTSERYRRFEASWEEQRAYVREAIAALAGSPLGGEAVDALQRIVPARPSLDASEPVRDPSAAIETAHFILRINPESGAIAYLQEKQTGRVWAAESNQLASYWYQTFAQADYDRFWRQYVINKRSTRVWSWPDQTKPGIAQAGAVARTWCPRLDGLYRREHEFGLELTAMLSMPEDSWTSFGAPRALALQLILPNDVPAVYLDLQWFEKPACRLPEAHWLSFKPIAPERSGWHMDMMGERISPLRVVRNGNRTLHAVGSDVTYSDQAGGLRIETLDAPLVAPGAPSLLNFNNRQPPVRNGMHFNLCNNVWGTNFRMWYDEDARYRFILQCYMGGQPVLGE